MKYIFLLSVLVGCSSLSRYVITDGSNGIACAEVVNFASGNTLSDKAYPSLETCENSNEFKKLGGKKTLTSTTIEVKKDAKSTKKSKKSPKK